MTRAYFEGVGDSSDKSWDGGCWLVAGNGNPKAAVACGSELAFVVAAPAVNLPDDIFAGEVSCGISV